MDLATLDATDQAALVASGQCTTAELISAAIERIEAVNPALNAVIIPLFDEALAADPAPGPFRGVPLLLKDLGCPVAGMPLYAGVQALRDRDHRSTADSYLAQAFRAAGFVVVGKTNTPELGLSPTTEPDSFGPTRNPWGTDRIVGGSSGGSASAVAAGLTPLAHAGDGGGSIRNPAGACGGVGLKPTRGRNSVGPGIGEGWSSCTTEHVITRSVRDTAAVLDLVSGARPGDPYVAPPPARPFLDEVGADPGRLRVGWYVGGGDAEAQAAVAGAVQLLDSLGHEVSDAYPPALDEAEVVGQIGGALVAANVAAELDRYGELTGASIGAEGVEPATWALAEQGRALTAVSHLRAVDEMHAYGRRLRSWWRATDGSQPADEGFDILVTPTMAEPAPPIGSVKGAPVERIIALVPYTMPYNLSGQPAIGVPLHWTAPGPDTPSLPLGVQLVAQYGREDLLIRLASQLEQAQPWHDRRPPVHA